MGSTGIDDVGDRHHGSGRSARENTKARGHVVWVFLREEWQSLSEGTWWTGLRMYRADLDKTQPTRLLSSKEGGSVGVSNPFLGNAIYLDAHGSLLCRYGVES